MKEFKGTPGPWIVVDDDYHANNTHSGITVETSGSGITIAVIGPNYEAPTYSQDVLNANLIAAARELLEALQAILRVADRATDEFDLARMAIAKALGESE